MRDDSDNKQGNSFQPINQDASSGSQDAQPTSTGAPQQPAKATTSNVQASQPQTLETQPTTQSTAQASGFSESPPPPPQSIMQPPKKTKQQEAQTQPVQPTPDIPPESLQVTGEKKTFPFNKIIIALVILILLGIWGFVGYTYFQNKQLKENEKKEDNQIAAIVTPTQTPITYNFEIENGNVVKMSSLGESELIIDKDNYEGTGITGFSYVQASADKDYLCFWSLPPALDPALYLGTLDGLTVTEIRKKVRECIWSPDSRKIAYVDDVSEDEVSSIYFYDIATQEEVNITNEATDEASLRRYNLVGWDDEETISCTYENLEVATSSASKNTCKINVFDATIQ